jgi:aminomethyltransferase
MTDVPQAPLRKTALHARHLASGARMVPFGGWDMPVQYTSVTAEHMAVRERGGLFDVSHMGEIELAGKQALDALQHVSCNDASRLQVGQAQYSGLLTPDGTFVDDILVYRLAPSHFMLVVNASNIAKDYHWIAAQIADFDAALVDASSRYALIAVQGPAAREALQPLTAVDLDDMNYYWFGHGEVAGARATVSRTGYTGEDGFEVFVPPNQADRVWQALLESGSEAGIVPCGLAARDTLRLEAGMRLCGSDIDDTTSALEADLGWIVGWKKPAFVGHERLRQQKAAGVSRKLVGFEMIDRGIARHGCTVMDGDAVVGTVTSGTQTPFLKKAIGMAYVPAARSAYGSEIEVDIRGRRGRARVVSMPFYKRG